MHTNNFVYLLTHGKPSLNMQKKLVKYPISRDIQLQNFQGRNPSNFWVGNLENWWLHKFTLTLSDLSTETKKPPTKNLLNWEILVKKWGPSRACVQAGSAFITWQVWTHALEIVDYRFGILDAWIYVMSWLYTYYARTTKYIGPCTM